MYGTCLNKFTTTKNQSFISDVSECADGLHNCHELADCAETDGGFTCGCKEGSTGNGIMCLGKISIRLSKV